MSHLGSGSSDLFDILQSHPRIDGFRTGMSYDHVDKLIALTQNIHKRDNASAIFMDELLFNTSFASRHIHQYCKFVYLVREPKASLSLIHSQYPEYKQTAERYYCYRLRGLYEYMRRTPDAIFMLWEDLKMGHLEPIQEYLGLKEALTPLKLEDISTNVVSPACQDCYERYVYHFRQLKELWSSVHSLMRK